MILKAKERGGGAQLARYLLSMRDNDHVELHEVRGFVGDDLLSAFREVDAIANGTRCENYLFSASLNPLGGETVTTSDFENAADEVERKLGLEGQPRAIVFHEKDGRRHAHVVWSRIEAEQMRAINLPHYKMRLRDVSRELFRAHGWEMPKGLRDWRERDPLGYTREEWQQARRVGLDPKQLKSLFQECWNRSDTGTAFAQALKERGFMLARGDRRGFVAVDYRGEVYAVARQAGVKTKEVAARLGDPEAFPSVDEARTYIAARMSERIKGFIRQAELEAGQGRKALDAERSELAARHQQERQALKDTHEKRWIAETKARAARLPRGFSGIWHRLTGKYSKIKQRNEREAWAAHVRDRAERDGLIASQLDERRTLQDRIRQQRERQQADLLLLREDVARYQTMALPEREAQRPEPETQCDKLKEQRSRDRTRDRGFER
ncbi:relaxase/mobilization nuclease domain-containing protein [Jannaschia helgolandensis]|uniref:Relaxase/Mobilisation nuclease domain-containing protein n=1 Tax=Jannaschia helgolandensis TaxID=188906 RepID=A0A1H7PKS3_9RHOB|nr:relaxase/mobilization nuclease domain-containing protein [Jannaschia helgolandensis]SEL35845.1 Relaxase/Mobilisation nuclease domain-containing protein [Jannaschia helgolandensis]